MPPKSGLIWSLNRPVRKVCEMFHSTRVFIRRIARAVRRRMVGNRATQPAAVSVEIAAPTLEFDTSPPRPLPEGWTEDQIRGVMSTFRIDGSAEGELDPYVNDALWRFLHTWGIVRHEKGRVLELGANPYFLTWMLHEFTVLDVDLANYFGAEPGSYNQTLQYRNGDSIHELSCDFQQFNLEESIFPKSSNIFL
jgi:hypothetical protein